MEGHENNLTRGSAALSYYVEKKRAISSSKKASLPNRDGQKKESSTTTPHASPEKRFLKVNGNRCYTKIDPPEIKAPNSALRGEAIYLPSGRKRRKSVQIHLHQRQKIFGGFYFNSVGGHYSPLLRGGKLSQRKKGVLNDEWGGSRTRASTLENFTALKRR